MKPVKKIVEEDIFNRVHYQVLSQVKSEEWGRVSNLLWSKIWDRVKGEVYHQVWNQVQVSVMDDVISR